MWRPDAELLAAQLSDYFGIPLLGKGVANTTGYPSVELRPSNCHRSEAFRLVVQTNWRGLDMGFIPDAFAGELVAQMGNPLHGRKQMFVRIAELCEAEKSKINLRVNGEPISPLNHSAWPEQWSRVEIRLTKSPASVNTEDNDANDAELVKWSKRFAGLVFSLLPLEEVQLSQSINIERLPEGAVIQMEVNRYERSLVNRAACIELHGVTCKACDFNFLATYGPVGEDFIHVHHVTPVSQLGPGYVIDPLVDLVPLCANCHAIAHRQDPPFRVADIRKMLVASLPQS